MALTGALTGCGSGDRVIPTGGPGPLVDCGGSGAISFPITSLSPGDDPERPPSIADGLRRYTETAGLDAPAAFQHRSVDDADWHVLGYQDDREAAVATGRWTVDGPGRAGQMWTLEKQGTLWEVSGGGDCHLEPVPSGHQAWATMLAPRGGLDRDSTSPVVLLSPRTCGHPRRVGIAEETETESTVSVAWSVPGPPTNVSCVGHPALREHLTLQHPLGSRTLLDGSLYPPVAVR